MAVLCLPPTIITGWQKICGCCSQALINMLHMPIASDQLTAAVTTVLHNVAAGSVEGCMLMLQGGFEMAAMNLLAHNGAHDDKQDEQLAAIIQQIAQKVPQAQVCDIILTWFSM